MKATIVFILFVFVAACNAVAIVLYDTSDDYGCQTDIQCETECWARGQSNCGVEV